MPKKKTPLYVLMLTGQGDTDICVVTKKVFDWIHEPYPQTSAFSVEETIPGSGKTVTVTIGSPDNDRALGASAHFDTGCSSLVEAMSLIKARGGELAGEYHGFIY